MVAGLTLKGRTQSIQRCKRSCPRSHLTLTWRFLRVLLITSTFLSYKTCGMWVLMSPVSPLYRRQNGIRVLEQLAHNDTERRCPPPDTQTGSSTLHLRGVPGAFPGSAGPRFYATLLCCPCTSVGRLESDSSHCEMERGEVTSPRAGPEKRI